MSADGVGVVLDSGSGVPGGGDTFVAPEGLSASGEADARIRPTDRASPHSTRNWSLTDPVWATGFDSIPIPPPDEIPVRFAQADAPVRDAHYLRRAPPPNVGTDRNQICRYP